MNYLFLLELYRNIIGDPFCTHQCTVIPSVSGLQFLTIMQYLPERASAHRRTPNSESHAHWRACIVPWLSRRLVGDIGDRSARTSRVAARTELRELGKSFKPFHDLTQQDCGSDGAASIKIGPRSDIAGLGISYCKVRTAARCRPLRTFSARSRRGYHITPPSIPHQINLVNEHEFCRPTPFAHGATARVLAPARISPSRDVHCDELLLFTREP